MHKTQFIEQLKEGERLDDVFLVKTARLAETRAGKPYLVLEVADRSGEIGGPIWEQAEEFQGLCQVGSFVHLNGQVQSYRDKLQLKIDGVRAVDRNEVDLADFVLVCDQDRGVLARELQALAATVKNPFLKKLLQNFFRKEPMWQRFQDAPAAKGIHHAYVGGLLEHSLSVARIADILAVHYSGVDRSLLLAGALLHDIGKVDELAMDVALIDYTAQGRLKGHLVMGSEMVAEAAAHIRDFPPELLTQLQHLILSHHGRQEFGSPTVPMTIEAFLLSFIDDLDAKMNGLKRFMDRDRQEGDWTEFNRLFDRYFLKSGVMSAAVERIDTPAREEEIQHGLFALKKPVDQ